MENSTGCVEMNEVYDGASAILYALARPSVASYYDSQQTEKPKQPQRSPSMRELELVRMLF